MNDKASRLQIIRNIIRTQKIQSQEQLLQIILDKGLTVTQATLSRDLKNLQIAKIPNSENSYCYSLPTERGNSDYTQGFINDIQRGIISIAFSGNMGVIKTRIGHANSVALALDSIGFDSILGTIAGDDTLFIVLNEKHSKTELVGQLIKIAPEMVTI